ncbi:MAG: M18 family aminopeptidase [Lachnospiraceae bacterium]|nr:M18 family aminopeptidase [Lachnospiraceae bacterium]
MDKKLENFCDFIEEGTSPFQVVEAAEKRLKEAGFEELRFETAWGITGGKKYYMVHHGTTLIAFTISKNIKHRDYFRIAAAHTDFPGLRVKPMPDVECKGYRQLNVEVYGGSILNTWLDRPLGIAGKVALRSETVFEPRVAYVQSKHPILTIPNLAIHMNKNINKGIELNRQRDMLPIVGVAGESETEKNFFIRYLSEELQVEPEDILDFELYAYIQERAQSIGIHKEMISSPRLDNLTSVSALLDGIIEGEREKGINVIALFDHEEIGSRTKQGAGSMLLRDVVEKIQFSLGRDACQVKEMLYQSMLLSVDVAHALHPNQADKTDITNQPILNKGICIKEAGNQSYATDCEAIAVVQQICEKEEIPYQKYVNRSDIQGGSTLGSIASSILPMKTVDIGIPILAMHSARELMGSEDMKSLSRFVTGYFSL